MKFGLRNFAIRHEAIASFAAYSVLFLASSPVKADILVAINSIGYNGTWERFASLTDAQQNTNAIESGTVPQRDLQMFLRQTADTVDVFQFVTAWNFGSNNPSNTRPGFMQISDIGFNSVDSLVAGWTDTNFDSYEIQVFGSNAMSRIGSTGNQETRAGVGPSDRITSGNWLEYNLNLTFQGLASNDTGGGTQRADDEPVAVLGDLFVLFESFADEDLDGNPNANLGFYRIDLEINQISWAVEQEVSGVFDETSTFEAPTTPIPETNSYGLLLGLIGLSLILKRRRRILH